MCVCVCVCVCVGRVRTLGWLTPLWGIHQQCCALPTAGGAPPTTQSIRKIMTPPHPPRAGDISMRAANKEQPAPHIQRVRRGWKNMNTHTHTHTHTRARTHTHTHKRTVTQHPYLSDIGVTEPRDRTLGAPSPGDVSPDARCLWKHGGS